MTDIKTGDLLTKYKIARGEIATVGGVQFTHSFGASNCYFVLAEVALVKCKRIATRVNAVAITVTMFLSLYWFYGIVPEEHSLSLPHYRLN